MCPSKIKNTHKTAFNGIRQIDEVYTLSTIVYILEWFTFDLIVS